MHSRRQPRRNRAGRTPGSAGSVMSMVVIGMSSLCVNPAETIDPSPAARRRCRPGSGLCCAVRCSVDEARSQNECGAPVVDHVLVGLVGLGEKARSE